MVKDSVRFALTEGSSSDEGGIETHGTNAPVNLNDFVIRPQSKLVRPLESPFILLLSASLGVQCSVRRERPPIPHNGDEQHAPHDGVCDEVECDPPPDRQSALRDSEAPPADVGLDQRAGGFFISSPYSSPSFSPSTSTKWTCRVIGWPLTTSSVRRRPASSPFRSFNPPRRAAARTSALNTIFERASDHSRVSLLCV